MDSTAIILIISTIFTGAIASIKIYKHLTGPRLKIAGYRKKENGDTIYFYAEVARKGKRVAKGCEAKIQINNYRYNGQWASWDTKQDIYTGEEFQLFCINKVHETITFPIGRATPIVDKPLSDYINKNLEIVVTSENAGIVSDKKTISDIMQSAVEVSSNKI